MKILAFDTIGDAVQMALWDAGEIYAAEIMPTRHDYAKIFLPLCETLLQKSKTNWDDIDRLAITSGPGSFTGLRVGLAAAYGLALARDIPLFGVSALDVLARQARPLLPEASYRLLALVDSRRDDYYANLYDEKGIASGAPFVLKPQDIEMLFQDDARPLFIVGAKKETQKKWSAFAALQDKLHFVESGPLPDLQTLAEMARAIPESAQNPSAIYVRGAEVSFSKRQKIAMASDHG